MRGSVTTLNGNPVSPASCAALRKADAVLRDQHYNDDAEEAYSKIVHQLEDWYYEGNCIAYGGLVSGSLDLVVD